jgi:PEGA domain
MTIRRAAKRLRDLGFAPVLVAALLLTASSAWAAGHSGGHSGGGHSGGGGHHAAPSGSSHGPGHSSSGRVGVPMGSGHFHGPSRQPGFHGGGFHGGHGGFHGGYYYPYYYPFGYGYWPGLYFGLGWGWGWGWDGWGWGDPYPYPGYGYGYGYGYGHYDRYSRDDMGALDLDISPGDTEVYVNGEKLGTVDDFDGWPQYLWLPKGTYDIVFYRQGYKTLSRQVSVYPGLVIDMDDRLEEGPSTLPQDLQPKTHERRDERLRYERERGKMIDRGEWDSRRNDDDNWRNRSHHGRDYDADRGDRGDRDHGDDAAAHGGDASWLHLSVAPEDASVYLDGRFVGTGTELGTLQNGLKVSPGKHHLAVVRPGHKPVEQDFDVSGGQQAKITIDLEDGR